MGALHGAPQPHQHVFAPNPQRGMVVVAARLDEVNKGGVGGNQIDAALLHQAQSVVGQVGAVLDAAHPGENRGAPTFIAVGVCHHRHTALGRLVDDGAQLVLRPTLPPRVGIGKAGAVGTTGLDVIHAPVKVDPHNMTKLVCGFRAGEQFGQARVGQEALITLGRRKHAGGQHLRAGQLALAYEFTQADVLIIRGAGAAQGGDAGFEGATSARYRRDVGVGIDESGQQIPAFKVNDLRIRRRCNRAGSNTGNLAVLDEYGGVVQGRGARAVDYVGVDEDKRSRRFLPNQPGSEEQRQKKKVAASQSGQGHKPLLYSFQSPGVVPRRS